jgi:hypothetical protein
VKKLAKILGIVAMTLAGVAGLLALYGYVVELAVPVALLGDGRVDVASWDEGYISATGTWVIHQERHSTPINASLVKCYRGTSECFEAQASVFQGYLSPDLIRYPIHRWDETRVEFTHDLPCVTYTYAVDRATQKLSGRRLKKDGHAEGCSLVIENDLRLSFVSGLEVVKGLRRENSPVALFLIIGTAFVFAMLFWIALVIRRDPADVDDEDDERPEPRFNRRRRQFR